MKNLLLILISFLFSINYNFYGQDNNITKKKYHQYRGITIPYRLFVPDNYDVNQKYPLLLRFHGASSEGTDNVAQLKSNLIPHLLESNFRNQYPCFMVFPQCPVSKHWDCNYGQVDEFSDCPVMENINDILDSLIRNYSIDPDRIYVSGTSMGGYGAWGMISRYPLKYAAAAIMCGVTVYKDVNDINHIPIWIFHSKTDPTVNVSYSRNMVSLLESVGCNFIYTHCNPYNDACGLIDPDSLLEAINAGAKNIYTEYYSLGHSISDTVFAQPGFVEWLFAQKKSQTTAIKPVDNSFNCDVFPNPAKNSVSFKVKIPKPSEVTLSVYNNTGQQCLFSVTKNITIENDVIICNTNYYRNGVYFYSINAQNWFYRGKLLIVR